jgi:hypothetical protein
MIKGAVIATLGLLELVTIQKPKQIASTVTEFVHNTTPLPLLPEALKPKAKRAVRRKHVCPYSREDIWGAFLVGMLLGAFIIFILMS